MLVVSFTVKIIEILVIIAMLYVAMELNHFLHYTVTPSSTGLPSMVSSTGTQ